MLSFLNLKSFPLYLFCSTSQPQHSLISWFWNLFGLPPNHSIDFWVLKLAYVLNYFKPWYFKPWDFKINLYIYHFVCYCFSLRNPLQVNSTTVHSCHSPCAVQHGGSRIVWLVLEYTFVSVMTIRFNLIQTYLCICLKLMSLQMFDKLHIWYWWYVFIIDFTTADANA